MDFYAVLDQVLELLRQRGRVTYNALKRQFGLDDACLQDLKDEIIEAQRLAVDENGTILVWTGGANPASLPLTAQTGQLQATQTDQAAPAPPIPGVSRHQQLALGETPNLAARIQGLAVPDALLVSAATHRLVQRYFACQDLGTHTLR